jgi:hypothetical protein
MRVLYVIPPLFPSPFCIYYILFYLRFLYPSVKKYALISQVFQNHFPLFGHVIQFIHRMLCNRMGCLRTIIREARCTTMAMREYISNLDITDRLNPRDSLYGGRNNAIQLFQEIQQPGETMEYYDFTRYVCVFCT